MGGFEPELDDDELLLTEVTVGVELDDELDVGGVTLETDVPLAVDDELLEEELLEEELLDEELLDEELLEESILDELDEDEFPDDDELDAEDCSDDDELSGAEELLVPDDGGFED